MCGQSCAGDMHTCRVAERALCTQASAMTPCALGWRLFAHFFGPFGAPGALHLYLMWRSRELVVLVANVESMEVLYITPQWGHGACWSALGSLPCLSFTADERCGSHWGVGRRRGLKLWADDAPLGQRGAARAARARAHRHAPRPGRRQGRGRPRGSAGAGSWRTTTTTPTPSSN